MLEKIVLSLLAISSMALEALTPDGLHKEQLALSSSIFLAAAFVISALERD